MILPAGGPSTVHTVYCTGIKQKHNWYKIRWPRISVSAPHTRCRVVDVMKAAFDAPALICMKRIDRISFSTALPLFCQN